ncbi:hypothetical protein [Actinomadura pelletieri]|nr:hypothetical protein [Actinomadura pelletieri]
MGDFGWARRGGTKVQYEGAGLARGCQPGAGPDTEPGLTALVRADNLAESLGLRPLWQ